MRLPRISWVPLCGRYIFAIVPVKNFRIGIYSFNINSFDRYLHPTPHDAINSASMILTPGSCSSDSTMGRPTGDSADYMTFYERCQSPPIATNSPQRVSVSKPLRKALTSSFRPNLTLDLAHLPLVGFGIAGELARPARSLDLPSP